MIEVTWLAISLIAGVITMDNVRDARHSLTAVQAEDGSVLVKARVLVAEANVRREVIRVIMCAALILVTIPSLLREGDAPLTPAVVLLMLIPIGMALNSYLDRQERHAIERLVAENGT